MSTGMQARSRRVWDIGRLQTESYFVLRTRATRAMLLIRSSSLVVCFRCSGLARLTPGN